MKLEERIDGFKHYEELFKTWEATELIIDNRRAFWQIKDPDSECRKVCLYRDGKDMFVYGDYGQFTFDSMTWLGDVYNLEYNNTGYQMEKLSYESKQALSVYDEDKCKKDILEWMEEQIRNGDYDIIEDDSNYESNLDILLSEIKERIVDYGFYVRDFCKEYKCKQIENLLEFVDGLLSNTDEYEWISYLRNNTSDWSDFEDCYESSLWNAGKQISQSYFICMYAIQVCGEKLREKQDDK